MYIRNFTIGFIGGFITGFGIGWFVIGLILKGFTII